MSESTKKPEQAEENKAETAPAEVRRNLRRGGRLLPSRNLKTRMPYGCYR